MAQQFDLNAVVKVDIDKGVATASIEQCAKYVIAEKRCTLKHNI